MKRNSKEQLQKTLELCQQGNVLLHTRCKKLEALYAAARAMLIVLSHDGKVYVESDLPALEDIDKPKGGTW